MHDEIVCRFNIRDDAPETVMDVVQFLVDVKHRHPDWRPDDSHPFFSNRKWSEALRGGHGVGMLAMAPRLRGRLLNVAASQNFGVYVHVGFLKWIEPWVLWNFGKDTTTQSDFVGYLFSEHDNVYAPEERFASEPTRIYLTASGFVLEAEHMSLSKRVWDAWPEPLQGWSDTQPLGKAPSR